MFAGLELEVPRCRSAVSGGIQYFIRNNKWFEDVGGLRDKYGLCRLVFSVF